MFPNGTASSLYALLVTGAFSYGYSLFMISLFRNEITDYTQLFDGFENTVKTIGLYLYMSFFIFLWSLLFIIPGIIASYRYSKSFYILVDNPDMRIPDIVNESKRMMQSNVLKNFCLDLSFIGWEILASLPTGLLGSVAGISIISNLADSGMLETVIQSGSLALAFDLLLPGSGNISMLVFQLLSLFLSIGHIFIVPYKETANIIMYSIMKGQNVHVQTQL